VTGSGTGSGAVSAWRRIAGLGLAVALTASLLTVVSAVVAAPGTPASAATSASTFDAGNIIGDDTFFNSATMSAADVQTFLNGKVSTCRTGYTCLKDYSQATTTRAADLYCTTYTGAARESAATIIAKVATACDINPQVLLVMLQKEQGLVLSTAPTSNAYLIAMGYGCPDTAACNTAYYGFANQVWNAAHQLQKYTKNSSMFSFQPGRNNIIQYSPSASCGTKTVYIQNQATADLYIYTPYTPNPASLAAGYGSAACGAYGNRNFYLYFSDWFGNPSNWLAAGGFEGSSNTGWTFATGVNHALRKDSTTAQAGDYYLVANTPVAGRTVSQTVNRATKVGEQANASIWLRSSSTAASTGTVSLTAIGGTAEKASVPFTVGTTWTKLTVALPARQSAHTGVRLDVAMTSTARNLYFDSATLGFGQAPVLENSLVNPSFEGSFGGWTPGNGFINQQIFKTTQAKTGSWFAASNTTVAGRSFSQTVPVTTASGDRWTASIWLRSSSANPFSGQVALWGLGGSKNVNTVKAYTVGSTWTRIQVTLDVGAVVPSRLKFEIYMSTVSSKGTLWLDGGSLARNRLQAGSFEAGATGWSHGAATNLAVNKATTAAPAADGTSYATTNTSVAASTLTQDVTLSPTVGDVYTAEVWVRSTSAKPFTGRLALWGLGAKNAAAAKSFTATPTWTLVQVTLPITVAYTSLRFQIYEDTAGSTVAIDGAQLY
jgi:hypothetical protein